MIAYPQYLDVPMMVSALAALQDGISDTGALASLGIDLEGRIGLNAEPTAANAIAQRHTVASLFGKLRAALADDIIAINSPEDLAGVQDGAFVELTGPLTRNPIIEFVNVMERLFAIAEIPPAAGTAQAAGLDMSVPDETRQVFMALRNELDTSPVVEATVACGGVGGPLTAVLSLQKGYVRHDSLDDLRFGRVRVLGKAVGALAPGQTWSMISRSFVGHMVSGAFREAMDGLQGINPDTDYPIEATIEGPGLFVIPLAVFV
ncbi:MAG: hypothetical protein ACI9WU_002728 [Myxococcota bacterium]|jgi:hypothetical protein